ncbi:unnamed protein product [Onchocerca ochengi]|uniref:MAM domain-containing protein n=1 Tax=Onchocerca ochengi TaxID=42157 RepID=A0A182EAP7_ONCOC|nr:unnamed protein product [Onchocerca ochengi]
MQNDGCDELNLDRHDSVGSSLQSFQQLDIILNEKCGFNNYDMAPVNWENDKRTSCERMYIAPDTSSTDTGWEELGTYANLRSSISSLCKAYPLLPVQTYSHLSVSIFFHPISPDQSRVTKIRNVMLLFKGILRTYGFTACLNPT